MDYTKATYFFDYHHPEIQKLISDYKDLSVQEQIRGLYLKVRDGFRYNPFNIGLRKEHYVSSTIAAKSEAHCIDKAIVYVSCLRALSIPARLHLAKVSNHIATERLEEKLGTNELAPHGLVDVLYKDKWVKCSPAFNKELCDMYQVDALDFDGTKDMIMQEYNKKQQKFMSYIEDYGSFEDVPLDFIINVFQTNFPMLYALYKGKDEVYLTI